MNHWWEHVVILFGVLIFVVVKIVAEIDYDNLVNWRHKVLRDWTLKAKLTLVVITAVLTYSVYLAVIRISSKP